MFESKVLIPVDFTSASDKALEFGKHIARKMQSNISLIHVVEDNSRSREESEAKLKEIAEEVNAIGDVYCDYICEEGSIFDLLPKYAAKPAFRMMILGTHGRQGLRQKLFGPDILKLLKRIPIPALVVQKGSTLPGEGFKTTVFPVGSHDKYDRKIDAMILMAGICDPEIHLYSISKPGFRQSEKLRENILLAEKKFSEKGISYKRIDEDQNVFSVGFAKQTLKYAAEINANLISVMVNPTQEYAYFADSDKEAIIMNEHAVPVLCTSNAEIEV